MTQPTALESLENFQPVPVPSKDRYAKGLKPEDVDRYLRSEPLLPISVEPITTR